MSGGQSANDDSIFSSIFHSIDSEFSLYHKAIKTAIKSTIKGNKLWWFEVRFTFGYRYRLFKSNDAQVKQANRGKHRVKYLFNCSNESQWNLCLDRLRLRWTLNSQRERESAYVCVCVCGSVCVCVLWVLVFNVNAAVWLDKTSNQQQQRQLLLQK